MAHVYPRLKHSAVAKTNPVNSRLSIFKLVRLSSHNSHSCGDIKATINNFTVVEATSHSIIVLGEPIQLSFKNLNLQK
jgi:hypothetical protein